MCTTDRPKLVFGVGMCLALLVFGVGICMAPAQLTFGNGMCIPDLMANQGVSITYTPSDCNLLFLPDDYIVDLLPT